MYIYKGLAQFMLEETEWKARNTRYESGGMKKKR